MQGSIHAALPKTHETTAKRHSHIALDGARSDRATGLLAARSGKRSEQITEEQLALFEAELKAQGVNVGDLSKDGGSGPDDKDLPASVDSSAGAKPPGRSPLRAHLKRERIVHDLAEAEKHCAACDQDLREFGEKTSERYEYIPVQLIVIEDVCKKYACECTVKFQRFTDCAA
jgi:zinc-finger binding domain of transposase IS66/Transposase C of IS166 homeodomain